MCMEMPMTPSSSTGITFSEGPERTDINLKQAQQELASILNVLRALMPADICRKPKVWSVPMFLIIHVLTPTIHVLWRIAEAFLVQK